jgi:hypothetical protein
MGGYVKIITPSEARVKKIRTDIPDIIFEVFNDEIQKNMGTNSSVVEQNVIVNKLCGEFAKCNNVTDLQIQAYRVAIYTNNWLDIEENYRKYGWVVEFHKTPYFSKESNYWVFVP